MSQEPSATTKRGFLCVEDGDFFCDEQCAECKAIEERERTGIPPEDKAPSVADMIPKWFEGDGREHEALAEALAQIRILEAKLGTQSETEAPFSREDAAAIVERKARALTGEYCRGDTGPGGYVWTNKEAEWQVILLEELAEEIRRGT